jgi:hypothetical protein
MTRDEALTLLGLTADCSADEMGAAYRWMVQAWHPDRLPPSSDRRAVATARTRSIIEAFEVLREKKIAAEVAGPEDPIATRGPRDSGRTPLQFSELSPEKVVPEPPEQGPRFRSHYGLLLAAFVVLGGVTATMVWARASDPVRETVLDPGRGVDNQSTSAAAVTLPAAPTPVVEPESDPLVRYSVSIGAFRDRARAMALLGQLQSEAPRVWMTIVPVDVSGIVFHRVLVGFADHPGFLDPIIDKVSMALGENPESWILRDAVFTLCVSEATSVADAETVMERMAAHDILPFSLRSMEGSVRVCAGAFARAEEADHLRSTLLAAGFAPDLTPPLGDPKLWVSAG